MVFFPFARLLLFDAVSLIANILSPLTAPAVKQALQGPDFLETEEQSPQRSDVVNAGEPMKEEIPQPRVTSPDGGMAKSISLI